MLSVDGQRAAYLALHDLAHEVAGGRWVATGGRRLRPGRGGPAGLDPPAGRRRRAAARPATRDARRPGASTSASALGRTAPHRLTDGRDPAYRDWSEGYDPGTWLDRAIHATREEVFPLHGLDPLP